MGTTKAISDVEIDLVGVVAYDSIVQTAIADSERLAKSSASCFEKVTPITAGQVVGSMKTTWGKEVPLKATKDASIVRWCEDGITYKEEFRATNYTVGEVGTVTVKSGSQTTTVPVVVDQSIEDPSWWWRLTRLP